jgi:hypothetical protein
MRITVRLDDALLVQVKVALDDTAALLDNMEGRA